MATVQDGETLSDPVTDHISGHGLAPFDNNSWHAADLAAEVVAHNNLEWVVVRWDWRQLETAKGTYATGATGGFNAATTWPYLPKDLLDYFEGHADPAVNACKVIILIEDRGFTGVSGKIDITFAAPSTITSGASEFSGWNGHPNGRWVEVSGAANGANNGVFTVNTGSNPLVVVESSLANESPGATVDIREMLLPDYMFDAGYALHNTGSPRSTTGARYRPYYQDRLGDLHDAICDAFRAEPNFGGIGSAETAGALTSAVDFDHNTYRDELMHMIQRASKAAKNHVFMFYQNYAGDPSPGDANLDLIAGWMVPYHNVYLCCPDLIPGGTEESRYYQRYTLYPDKLKQMLAIQHNSYGTSLTMPNLYLYGTRASNPLNQGGSVKLVDGLPWTTAVNTYSYDPDGVAVIDANAGPFR